MVHRSGKGGERILPLLLKGSSVQDSGHVLTEKLSDDSDVGTVGVQDSGGEQQYAGKYICKVLE